MRIVIPANDDYKTPEKVFIVGYEEPQATPVVLDQAGYEMAYRLFSFIPEWKIQAIKFVRDFCSSPLGLKEAKDCVDAAYYQAAQDKIKREEEKKQQGW